MYLSKSKGPSIEIFSFVLEIVSRKVSCVSHINDLGLTKRFGGQAVPQYVLTVSSDVLALPLQLTGGLQRPFDERERKSVSSRHFPGHMLIILTQLCAGER